MVCSRWMIMNVQVFPAKRSAAILLDGSQMVHGTDPFLPDAPPPPPLSRASMNKVQHPTQQARHQHH